MRTKTARSAPAAPRSRRAKATETTGAFFPAPISILGYREEKEWVALALEMDIRGFGPTFEEALDDLRDLVLMQVSFALSQDKPEMIWKNAEPVYFQLYETARREEVLDAIQERKGSHSLYQTGGLQVPPAHVIASHRRQFAQADA